MAQEPNKGERDAEFGILGASYADVILLLFLLLLVYVLQLVFADNVPLSSLLHALHVFLAIPGILIFAWERLLYPQYFTIVSIGLFIVDVFIFINRFINLLDALATGNLFEGFPAFILLLAAALFVFTSVVYFVSSLRAYDTSDVVLPLNNKQQSPGATFPQQTAQKFLHQHMHTLLQRK